jgi:uncharacterized protein YndB with AHSA1/START domain
VALIDQRILIDAPPQVIWELISDPDKLTRWHAGYSGVSVLTTQRTGIGTRRRCSPVGGGKDFIEEVTAWVDGLGYEYTLIEGGPYRSLQGRLRLQVVPDGTTVQWTVSYRPKGLLGFVHNQLKGRRQLAQMMAASLRQLRRQIDTLGVRMDDVQRAKAGIQDRLDVNARAQYQRRYAPPPGLETAGSGEAAAAVMPAEEQPPIPASKTPDIPVTAVPSFVADLTAEAGEPDYSHKADTQPRPPEGLREAIAAQQAGEKPSESADIAVSPETADALPAPPKRIEPPAPATAPAAAAALAPTPAPEILPVQPSIPTTPAEAQPPVKLEPEQPSQPTESEYQRITPARGIPSVRPMFTEEQPTQPEEAPTKPKPPREPPKPETAPGETAPADHLAERPPQTPPHDTGEISIWEVFGVKRPSEQDNETLEDLIRSVHKKKAAAKRRVGRRIPKRPIRIRRVEAAIGLRMWLALRAARIRLNEVLYTDED